MRWRDDLRAIIERVPRDKLPDLAGELARGQAIVWQQLSSAPKNRTETGQPKRGARYLKPAKVAKRLDVSDGWVYQHADELGAVKLDGALRIPEKRLDSYLKARTVEPFSVRQ